MAVPDWNRVESSNAQVGTTTVQESRDWNTQVLEDIPSESVEIQTTHWGRAEYTERGYTSVNVRDAIDSFARDNLWNEYEIDPQDMDNNDVLTICRVYFEDDWEIGEYGDLEHDNWDQQDSEVSYVDFN